MEPVTKERLQQLFDAERALIQVGAVLEAAVRRFRGLSPEQAHHLWKITKKQGAA